MFCLHLDICLYILQPCNAINRILIFTADSATNNLASGGRLTACREFDVPTIIFFPLQHFATVLIVKPTQPHTHCDYKSILDHQTVFSAHKS